VKTRVRRFLNHVTWQYQYEVTKWGLYDDAELRRYHPDKETWNPVRILLDKDEAIELARRIHETGEVPDEIIAEFGDET
jgi:hypothetical protein